MSSSENANFQSSCEKVIDATVSINTNNVESESTNHEIKPNTRDIVSVSIKSFLNDVIEKRALDTHSPTPTWVSEDDSGSPRCSPSDHDDCGDRVYPSCHTLDNPLPETNKFSHSGYLDGRIRYNLVLNAFIILLGLSPFVLTTTYILCVQIIYALFWLIFFCNYLRSSLKLFTTSHSESCKLPRQVKDYSLTVTTDEVNDIESGGADAPSTLAQHQQVVVGKEFKYIMNVFTYKEPQELMIQTLDNIVSLTHSEKLIVCVGMEERTPDRDLFIAKLNTRYHDKFEQFLVTVHPYGTLNEIPGKCSNTNYSHRMLVNHLKHTVGADFCPKNYFITNFDVDSRFQTDFLIKLDQAVKASDRRYRTVWQPLLFYNWDLEKRNMFVRVTSVLRNMFMMGALVPFQLNVMSVFTFSLDLCIAGNYTHPSYQMDDIICYIRWCTMVQEDVVLMPLYSATLSGPTAGATFYEEVSEWARQIRRWTIGSAEVFHYFVVKFYKFHNKPRAVKWGVMYFVYYAFFLVGQGVFMITAAIALNLVHTLTCTENVIQLCTLGFTYLVLLLTFIVNRKSLIFFPDQKEKIPVFVNVMHVVLAPVVLVCYGLVALYGLFEVVVSGKKVCKHGASKKTEL